MPANERDVAARGKGLSPAMIDRLVLDEKRIAAMASGLREVAALPDPVGEVTGMWRRPNGLQVGRMRIPLGVIGIVYESRPNVTADAAGLCLKSGNAVVLRGGLGSDPFQYRHRRNAARASWRSLGLPPAALQVVATTDRDAVLELLQREEEIDLIIPRGGERADPLRGGKLAHSRHQALQGRLPRLHRRQRRFRDGGSRSASTPRCSAPACATPWRRC